MSDLADIMSPRNNQGDPLVDQVSPRYLDSEPNERTEGVQLPQSEVLGFGINGDPQNQREGSEVESVLLLDPSTHEAPHPQSELVHDGTEDRCFPTRLGVGPSHSKDRYSSRVLESSSSESSDSSGAECEPDENGRLTSQRRKTRRIFSGRRSVEAAAMEAAASQSTGTVAARGSKEALRLSLSLGHLLMRCTDSNCTSLQFFARFRSFFVF